MNSFDGFELQHISEEKGKGIFATKLYKERDVIFEEKPIVSAQFAWNKEYKYLACDHCLRPLETTQENVNRLTQSNNFTVPYPEFCPTDKSKHCSCPECGVQYCSEDCQQEASKRYHQMLCQFREPLATLYSAWMNVHYPPETTSIELLLRIIAYIEQSSDVEGNYNRLMQFSHETIDERTDTMLKLLGENFSAHLQQIQPLVAQSLPTTIMSTMTSEKGLLKLFGLIGRNGQGVGTSVYSEWVRAVTEMIESSGDGDIKKTVNKYIDDVYHQMDEVVGNFLNCEGSGLYELQHYVNHSCVPNATVMFPYSDHTLRLVAITDIHPGDEICITYLDECALFRSRHSRNNILKGFYLFQCQCPKCLTSDEPDETSEDEEESDDEISE